MMIGANERGAIGEMTNSAWCNGRRTGFIEGLIVGVVITIAVVVVRFAW